MTFDQVLSQIETFKSQNAGIENVVGRLMVDQEVINKIMSENAGVTKLIFIENFEDFVEAGGVLYTYSGTKEEQNDLNGIADRITKELYELIKNHQ